MCAMVARAQACSGLQVSTAQALSLALCGNCDGCVQEQVTCILQPLQAAVPPLSSAVFEEASMLVLLRTNLATQPATRESRELAQHVN